MKRLVYALFYFLTMRPEISSSREGNRAISFLREIGKGWLAEMAIVVGLATLAGVIWLISWLYTRMTGERFDTMYLWYPVFGAVLIYVLIRMIRRIRRSEEYRPGPPPDGNI